MRFIHKLPLNKLIFKSVNIKTTSKRYLSSNIVTSDWQPVPIPKISINDLIYESCRKWPDKIALECGITETKYTYDELIRKSTNLNRHFRQKLNLQKGDVVAVLLPNIPEFAIATLGALKAGLTVTTINPLYTAEEITKQLKDSNAKAVITLVEFVEAVKNSVNNLKRNLPILAIKSKRSSPIPQNVIDFYEFLQKSDYDDVPSPNSDDLAFIPYSSGTTGLPKGVELTHYNIISNLTQFQRVNVLRQSTNDFQDIIPAVLPFFHIYGLLATLLSGLQHGSKIICLPKFMPDLYVNTIKKHKTTVLFLAPPIVLFLAGHPSVKRDDLQSIRLVMSGAAPLGVLDEERFIRKAGRNIDVLQGYGLTETSPLIAICSPGKKSSNLNGTIGKIVFDTTAKIVDPSDPNETPLGPNEIGELLVKGPQVMRGYHNKPKETQEAFTKDGWFKTGDLTTYNEDKYFFVKDRLKELIKVKGFQVPPAELEEVIRSHPDVDDVGVVGIPDSRMGEVPRAYIVPKPGKKINAENITEFVKDKVAPYKQLKGGIEFIDTIPKNASGKILRRILKEKYLEDHK